MVYIHPTEKKVSFNTLKNLKANITDIEICSKTGGLRKIIMVMTKIIVLNEFSSILEIIPTKL